ncbi:MAG: argininosuccinate synthase [Candidatus Levyibacteriota bacterium]
MQKDRIYHKVASYEGKKGEVKKVVFLYSGDSRSSALIKWIQEEYKAAIITLTLDIGQQHDFEKIKQQAHKYGAATTHVIDAKDEFADEYVAKCLQANASYQTHNHLAIPLSRFLLAKWAVKVAALEGADAIAHGASGRDNDQVLIESTILTLNPDIKIIAPNREENQIQEDLKTSYVFSNNLWGTSIKGKDIDNPTVVPQFEQILNDTKIMKKQELSTEILHIEFVKGLPVVLNNKRMKLSELIITLNKLGKTYGLGVTPHIEDQLVGLKRRIILSAPAAEILTAAHKKLEEYVSTKSENEFKPIIDMKWTNLCHNGLWYEPLMDDLTAYIQNVNQKVTGKVQVKLSQGNHQIVALETPHNIFEEKLATFVSVDSINPNAAAGFIELHSLQTKLARQAEKTAFISIGKRTNKIKLLPQMKQLHQLGYKLYATYKTHKFLRTNHMEATPVHKISEGHLKPNLADLLNTNRFDLIINIPIEKKVIRADEKIISQKAHEHNVPILNTVPKTQELVKKLQMIEMQNSQPKKEIYH